MTTFDQRNVRCGACGQESVQLTLTSTSSFGPPDLDMRPAQLARSALWLEVQRCPECGYCAADISEKPGSGGMAALESDLYRQQFSDETYPDLANSFLCHAILLVEGAHDHVAGGWACLSAAWVCDDAELSDAARTCRTKAVKLFHAGAPLDGPGESCLLRADLHRRIADFDQADVECRLGLEEDPNPLIRRLLEYEQALIATRDESAHQSPDENR
jgi:hypothetical protein